MVPVQLPQEIELARAKKKRESKCGLRIKGRKIKKEKSRVRHEN